MDTTKKDSRISGLLYLILILSGIFNLLYVPSKLIIWKNPIETHKNIIENIDLFKIGILSDIIMFLTFILLSFSLYKLLKKVHENVSIIMVILVLISVTISFANLIPKLDVIYLIQNSNYLDSISFNEQSERLLLLLKSNHNGILMNQIFWGLWLFPFGYLVFKSKILPKFFGILLMIGCFGYITDFIGFLFFPKDYGKTIIPILATIPHAVGEIGICLWFLIVGAKTENKI